MVVPNILSIKLGWHAKINPNNSPIWLNIRCFSSGSIVIPLFDRFNLQVVHKLKTHNFAHISRKLSDVTLLLLLNFLFFGSQVRNIQRSKNESKVKLHNWFLCKYLKTKRKTDRYFIWNVLVIFLFIEFLMKLFYAHINIHSFLMHFIQCWKKKIYCLSFFISSIQSLGLFGFIEIFQERKKCCFCDDCSHRKALVEWQCFSDARIIYIFHSRIEIVLVCYSQTIHKQNKRKCLLARVRKRTAWQQWQ